MAELDMPLMAPEAEKAPEEMPVIPAAAATTEQVPEVTEDHSEDWAEVGDPDIKARMDAEWNEKKGKLYIPFEGQASTFGGVLSGVIEGVKTLSPAKGIKRAKEELTETPVEDVYDPKTGRVNLRTVGKSLFSPEIRNALSAEKAAAEANIPIEATKKILDAYGIPDVSDSMAVGAFKRASAAVNGSLGNLLPFAIRKMHGTDENSPIPEGYLEGREAEVKAAIAAAKSTGKPQKLSNLYGSYEVTPEDNLMTAERKDFNAAQEGIIRVVRQEAKSGTVETAGLFLGAVKGPAGVVLSPIATGLEKALATKIAAKLLPRAVAWVARSPVLTSMATQGIEQGILMEPTGGTLSEELAARGESALVGSAMAGGLGGVGKLVGKVQGSRMESAPEVGTHDPAALQEAIHQVRDPESPVRQALESSVVARSGGTRNLQGVGNTIALAWTVKDVPGGQKTFNIEEAFKGDAAGTKTLVDHLSRYDDVINEHPDVVREAMIARGDEHLSRQFEAQRGGLPDADVAQYLLPSHMRDIVGGPDRPRADGTQNLLNESKAGAVAMQEPGAVATKAIVSKLSASQLEDYHQNAESYARQYTVSKERAERLLPDLLTRLDETEVPDATRDSLRALGYISEQSVRTMTPADVGLTRKYLRDIAPHVDAAVVREIARDLSTINSHVEKASESMAALPSLVAGRNIVDPRGALTPAPRRITKAEAVIEKVQQGGDPQEARRVLIDHLAPFVRNLEQAEVGRIASHVGEAVSSIAAKQPIRPEVVQEFGAILGNYSQRIREVKETNKLYQDAAKANDAQGMREAFDKLRELGVAFADDATPRQIASAAVDLRRKLGEGSITLARRFQEGMVRYNEETTAVIDLREQVNTAELKDVPGILVRLNNASRNFMLTENLKDLGLLQQQMQAHYMESAKGLDISDVKKLQMFELLVGDVNTRMRVAKDPTMLTRTADHVMNMLEVNNMVAKELLDATAAAVEAKLGKPVSKEFLLGYFLRPETLMGDMQRLNGMGLSGKDVKAASIYFDKLRQAEGSFFGNTESVSRQMSFDTLLAPLESFDAAQAEYSHATRAESAFINKVFTPGIEAKLNGEWAHPDVDKALIRFDGKGKHLDFYDKFVLDPANPNGGTHVLEPLGVVHKALFVDSNLGTAYMDLGRETFIESVQPMLLDAYAGTPRALDAAFIHEAAGHLYDKWADMRRTPTHVWEMMYEKRKFIREVDAKLHIESGKIIAAGEAKYAQSLGIHVVQPRFRERFVFNSPKHDPSVKLDLDNDVFHERQYSGLVRSTDAGQLNKAAAFTGKRGQEPDAPLGSLLRRIHRSVLESHMAHPRTSLENHGAMLEEIGWARENTWLNTFVRGGDIDTAQNVLQMIAQSMRAHGMEGVLEGGKAVSNLFLPVKAIAVRLSHPWNMFRNAVQQTLTEAPMRGIGTLPHALGSPLRVVGAMLSGMEAVPMGRVGIMMQETLAFAENRGRIRRNRISEEVHRLQERGAFTKKVAGFNDAVDSALDNLNTYGKERFEVAAARDAGKNGTKLYGAAEELVRNGDLNGARELLTKNLPYRNAPDIWNIVRSMEKGGDGAFRSFIRQYMNDAIGRYGKMSVPQWLHRYSRLAPGAAMFFAAKTNLLFRHGTTVSQGYRQFHGTLPAGLHPAAPAMWNALITTAGLATGIYVLQNGVPGWEKDEGDNENHWYDALRAGLGNQMGLDFVQFDPSGVLGISGPFQSRSWIRVFSIEIDQMVAGLARWNKGMGEAGAWHLGESELDKAEIAVEIARQKFNPNSPEVTSAVEKLDAIKTKQQEFFKTNLADLALASNSLTGGIQKIITKPVLLANLWCAFYKDTLLDKLSGAHSGLELAKQNVNRDVPQERPIASMLSPLTGEYGWDLPQPGAKPPEWLTAIVGHLGMDPVKYSSDFTSAVDAIMEADETYNIMVQMGIAKPWGSGQAKAREKLTPAGPEMIPLPEKKESESSFADTIRGMLPKEKSKP